LRDITDSARALLNDRMCEASEGQVMVAAVVGAWRRVEVLTRRVLAGPPMPQKIEVEVQAEGTRVATAVVSEIEQAWLAEVHESVVHLTEEDEGQVLQLIVFHVGLSSAYDQAFNGMDAKAKIAVDSADAEENRGKDLGTLKPPAKWVLAEYIVDGGVLMPFDEDEMERPVDEETEEEKTQAMLKQLVHHFDKVNHLDKVSFGQSGPSSPTSPQARRLDSID
jgi:hypothetical protein